MLNRSTTRRVSSAPRMGDRAPTWGYAHANARDPHCAWPDCRAARDRWVTRDPQGARLSRASRFRSRTCRTHRRAYSLRRECGRYVAHDKREPFWPETMPPNEPESATPFSTMSIGTRTRRTLLEGFSSAGCRGTDSTTRRITLPQSSTRWWRTAGWRSGNCRAERVFTSAATRRTNETVYAAPHT